MNLSIVAYPGLLEACGCVVVFVVVWSCGRV